MNATPPPKINGDSGPPIDGHSAHLVRVSHDASPELWFIVGLLCGGFFAVIVWQKFKGN